MDLASVFSTQEGNAEPFPGLTDAWRWQRTDRFHFGAALNENKDRAFQSCARDFYDEDLMRAVLLFARQHDAELKSATERPLTLIEGFSHPGFLFDAMVAIGPEVHKYQDDEDVNGRTLAVFPAYRSEFAGDENEDETHFRFVRAPGVHLTVMDREPRPFVKARYRGDDGREAKKRKLANLAVVVNLTCRLENSDKFVEFENYRHEVWRADWDGTWKLTAQDGTAQDGIIQNDTVHEFNRDELIQFLKETLYGPNLDAGTAEFPANPG